MTRGGSGFGDPLASNAPIAEGPRAEEVEVPVDLVRPRLAEILRGANGLRTETSSTGPTRMSR